MLRRATFALLLLPVLFVQSPADESMEELLQQYRRESDLSKQTIRENAGYVVVYTRDDLERMQVYRLSDLIKSVRFLRYDLNSFGMPDPLEKNPVFYSSDIIKIYVNEHEISSGFSGSGLQFYGNIDMGMFDHVEIYYDAPILDVSTEPAAAVIKLYTKVPERELGGSLQARIGCRGTREASVSHAMVFDKWSYFAYAEGAVNRFAHESHGAGTISRDYDQQHLYVDLHRETQRLELEYLGQKHDPFTAQSSNIDPVGGDFDNPFFRASYSGTWMQEALQTEISYIYSDLKMQMDSASPFWGQLFEPFFSRLDPTHVPHSFNIKAVGDLLTAKARYTIRSGAHLMKIGGVYRYKAAKLKDYAFDGYYVPDRTSKFNIWSGYLQDQIAISDHSMFSFSAKVNYFDFHPDSLSQRNREGLTTWQGRMGFNTIRGKWYSKMFLTHVEYPTQLFEMTMHGAELDSTKLETLSGEIKRIDDSDEVRWIVSASRARDVMLIENLLSDRVRLGKKSMNLYSASFDYIHHFGTDHRMDFNIFYTHVHESFPYTRRDTKGGYLRFLNTFGDLDIFNELIYRDSSKLVNEGWDYNAGLKYHVTKDFSLALKGVNILNDARETRYQTLTFDLRSIPPGLNLDGVTLPVVERQFLFSLEWLF